MNIKIIRDTITKEELAEIAKDQFGDWIKVVVDIEKGIMAVGGDLHADEEAALLENGCNQKNLWGANIWFEKDGDERIQFDSMINIRPAQGNRGRTIESQDIQEKVAKIINDFIVW